MKPTATLRFLARDRLIGRESGINIVDTVQVLQQWWEERSIGDNNAVLCDGEWRDVPVETEEND